jgi:hypothetical protein
VKKSKKFLAYTSVIALILAAIIISLLFYRQKIETTNTVFKNLTEDWQAYKSDKYGISFKYPKDWQINDLTGTPYERPESFLIIKQTKPMDNYKKGDITVGVSGSRNINIQDSQYAIQISIPFDKQNYLIFSTSTESDQKEIFYNIPVTLVVGK